MLIFGPVVGPTLGGSLPSNSLSRLARSSGGDVDRVLQCIEEAHELKGQDVRLLGDGSPKLSPSTYCAALNALASCQSVGMRDGTKARRVCSSHPSLCPCMHLISSICRRRFRRSASNEGGYLVRAMAGVLGNYMRSAAWVRRVNQLGVGVYLLLCSGPDSPCYVGNASTLTAASSAPTSNRREFFARIACVRWSALPRACLSWHQA